jgi:hypothetical protein
MFAFLVPHYKIGIHFGDILRQRRTALRT